MCRCDTSGHGLAGMVVMGWRLDLMILEVFSNLNDSMRCKGEQGRWRAGGSLGRWAVLMEELLPGCQLVVGAALSLG